MDVDGNNQIVLRRQIVKREIIRVEPFDSNFEKWGVPVSTCTRAGDMIFVSGLPGWRFESSPVHQVFSLQQIKLPQKPSC